MAQKTLRAKDVAAAMNAYSPDAVAKVAGVAARTVTNWFDKGLLKAFRVPGTKWRRVYEDDLVRFLLEYDMRVPEQMLWRYKQSQVKGA